MQLHCHCTFAQVGKNAVETFAIEGNCHQRKFANQKGIELSNSDWITGVDHDNLHTAKDKSNGNGDNEPELEQSDSDGNNESHTSDNKN